MLAVLLLTALASGGEVASPEPPAVELSQLRQHPSRWIGSTVRFTLQVDGPREDVPTHLSSFRAGRFFAFAAWSGDQVLWRGEHYGDPAERLFARRDGVAAAALAGARRYARFEVVGVVREIFQGTPWIEVVEARQLQRSLSEGALVHATRAVSLMETERWALAADQFGRARAGFLPRAALAELARLQSVCAELGDPANADRGTP